jgi:hypothetical protein
VGSAAKPRAHRRLQTILRSIFKNNTTFNLIRHDTPRSGLLSTLDLSVIALSLGAAV